MKTSWLILLIISVLISLCHSQFSPIWQESPYMEAKNVIAVNNNQKTYGTYTLNITFYSIYANPVIALAIPQLRVVSNPTLKFKSYHSALTTTGFYHNLYIPDANTVVWYLLIRYIVFNSAQLLNEFQTVFKEDIPGGNLASSPDGTYRTDNFNVALSPSLSMSGQPTCIVFLAGVDCLQSTDYQLNLTCTVTAASTAIVKGTVYPSTQVSNFSIYVVAWDPVYLAVQSYYFVDYAITTTYYNVQKSFITLPYGYIDRDYIGGTSCFSTSNNMEHNITLSSLLVYTTPSSLFDAVTQFQVRVRNCSQSLYPYYNKNDGLCYHICPNYTYALTNAFACQPCLNGCSVCMNSSICTTCATGMALVNSTCVCANYTFNFNGVCYGCHYSCLSCISSGQYFNCLTCDSNMYRQSVAVSGFNNYCSCMSGFVDVGVTLCADICGDGVAKTDPCDDGNTVSGDGCSNICKIQSNFTCTKDGSNFSSCYYKGNVSISIVKIYKADYSNTATVYIQVSPWIDSMSQLANAYSLTSNASSISNVQCSVQYGLLAYQIDYSVPLSHQYVRFQLRPTTSGIFSQMPPANVTYYCLSDNGYRLLTYTDYQYKVSISFSYVSRIFGYLILASAFIYIFGRLKWQGNLLFFSLQFQYLSMVILQYITPMLSGLSQIKTVLGFNEIFPQQAFYLPKYKAFYGFNFNIYYQLNVNFMVTLQVLALIMYLIYYITYNRNRIVCRKYGGDPEKTYRALKYGKILSFFDWEFFMFWTFFNMTEQITAMILFTQSLDYTMIPLIIFNAVCIIVAVLPLFIKRKQVKSYTELLYYKDRGRQQSLVSFFCFCCMYIFLAISVVVAPIIYYLIFLFPISMIIYLFCRKPFQSRWVRVAYFINNFCIIMILIYNKLIQSMEDTVFFLPIGSFVIIIFDWIFNIIVWARQAYVICKYGDEKDLNEILQSNTKTTYKEDQNDYFKASPIQPNQSFLNSILKNSKAMEQNKDTRRPLRRNQQYDPEDLPEIKEQRKDPGENQEMSELENLKKNREKWARQMKQMKQIKMMRSKTPKRQEQRSPTTPPRSKIRSTNQKGVDASKITGIEGRTIRYM